MNKQKAPKNKSPKQQPVETPPTAVETQSNEVQTLSTAGAGHLVGHAMLRSHNLHVPLYVKLKPDDDGPSAAQILKYLGLELTPPLSVSESRALLKPPETFHAITDNAVEQFEKDAKILALRDFAPEQMKALFNRAEYLRTRKSNLEQAALVVQHQQMVANSDMQEILLRIRRRVVALSDEWPELAANWRFLLDYFERLYPGRGFPEEEEPSEGASDKQP